MVYTCPYTADDIASRTAHTLVSLNGTSSNDSHFHYFITWYDSMFLLIRSFYTMSILQAHYSYIIVGTTFNSNLSRSL